MRIRVAEGYDVPLALAFAFLAFAFPGPGPGPGPLRSSPLAPDFTATADAPTSRRSLDTIELLAVGGCFGRSFRPVRFSGHIVNRF